MPEPRYRVLIVEGWPIHPERVWRSHADIGLTATVYDSLTGHEYESFPSDATYGPNRYGSGEYRRARAIEQAQAICDTLNADPALRVEDVPPTRERER